MRQAITSHLPVDTDKPEGWNCRDWVMECIEIMKEGGWAYDDIKSQGDLFPALKQASVLTEKQGRPAVVNLGEASNGL